MSYASRSRNQGRGGGFSTLSGEVWPRAISVANLRTPQQRTRSFMSGKRKRTSDIGGLTGWGRPFGGDADRGVAGRAGKTGKREIDKCRRTSRSLSLLSSSYPRLHGREKSEEAGSLGPRATAGGRRPVVAKRTRGWARRFNSPLRRPQQYHVLRPLDFTGPRSPPGPRKVSMETPPR